MYCSLCVRIPFLKLPSEDEDGHPHHESLAALSESATKCPLCQLILEAGKLDEASRKIRGNNAYSDPYRPYFLDLVKRMADSPAVTDLQQVSNSDQLKWKSYVRGEPYDRLINHEGSKNNDLPTAMCSLSRASPAVSQNSGLASKKEIRPWIFGSWWLSGELKSLEGSVVPQLVGIGVRFSRTPGPQIINLKTGLRNALHLVGAHIRVLSDDDGIWSNSIPGRIRELDSTSSQAIGRMKKWIQKCDSQHKCVSFMVTNDSSQLPIRVLDIGPLDSSDENIKLIDYTKALGLYVALSHCWGTRPRAVTTKGNIEEFRRGISLTNLPRTFKEAVWMTKSLGVRYLWIDCFCIIQDDRDDWAREAARMAGIYSGAYLTLAASAGVDSYSGVSPLRSAEYSPPECLSLGHPTVRLLTPAARIELANANDYSSLGKVDFFKQWSPVSTGSECLGYKIGTFGKNLDPLQKEHISSRGWCTQERLLSPRTIHFAQDQMYWECGECLLGEDGSCFPTPYGMEKLITAQKISFAEHGMGKGWGMSMIEGHWPQKNKPRGRWDGGWLAAMENFCSRSLTVEMDKLPALSGLARFVAGRTNDTYLAGLWKNHLIEDLHWRVYGKEEISSSMNGRFQLSFGQKLCEPRKTKQYRAPSWSWASLDSHIRFIELDFDRIVADVLEVQVRPSGSDQFGMVKDGYLMIHAPFFKVQPLRASHTAWDKHGTPAEISLPSGISIGNIHFDFYDPEWKKVDCFALFLDAANCIVLKAASGAGTEGQYQRIGIGQFIRPTPTRNLGYKSPAKLELKLGVNYIYSSGTWGPVTDSDAKQTVVII